MLVDISLQEIINAGGTTNYYHIFLLVSLITAMPEVPEVALDKKLEFSNEVELTEIIKKLTSEEHVKLAKALLARLQSRNCAAMHPIDMIDWMRYVIRKQ